MSVPLLLPAFTAGEVSPSLFGRFDLARMHTAASTMRNMWISYRGGAYSRAGTKFITFSKQTGRNFPPRLITFQKSINQGLALEFGHQYMRVILNGAVVTEAAAAISGVTQAQPGVITVNAKGVSAATPINSGVTRSYIPGEGLVVAGGSFTTPAILGVTDTLLLSTAPFNAGQTYAPGDTIHITGGTQTTPAVLTVSVTQVVSATVGAAGSGGTAGAHIVTGTTGTGTKFQANVTISGGGAITAVNSITNGGFYTVNPSATDPVTGAGLSGASLNVTIGIQAVTVSTPGVFTADSPDGTFTQASTSGSGTGATFKDAIMGVHALAVREPGVYYVFPTNPATASRTSAQGIGIEFNLTSTPVASFGTGDWVYISGVKGMTELNGNIYTLLSRGISGSAFDLLDVYGVPVDTTGYDRYISGGTAARVFTLATPWNEEDLDYLKITESADKMTICCVNQMTGAEYQPQDLIRISYTNWTLTPVIPDTTTIPPTPIAVAASGSGNAYYHYVVTSVASDGTESAASPPGAVGSAVDIATTAGAITVSWAPIAGIFTYNVYKLTPGINSDPSPVGLYGFAGQTIGTQFTDGNIVPDFAQVPPTHVDPFARGRILDVVMIATGAGVGSATIGINTSTGSGFNAECVVTGGLVVQVVILDNGHDYLPGDTAFFTYSGGGSGTAASLVIGAETGTYPSVPGYFQQRRAFANSLNEPDTYWLSQPGAFSNFDVRDPTIASDAITGTPWSVQVNGIQFLVPMPGGLVVMTGLEAYLLSGTGGSAFTPQPLTPSSQQALPQGFNGCNQTVPPIRIYQDIIYLQAKGSIYRDFTFNINSYTFTGSDITVNSSHMFIGYNIIQHAWCEEPHKQLWAVRNDGIMLNLTWLKDQQVMGWSRHDTNGYFRNVCSVIEPPVDALYIATERFPGTHTAYMIERMDDRLWKTVEDCWCVDCALELTQPSPGTSLTASSATGLGAITGVANLAGGRNYSANTTATVVDDNDGPGTGAVPTLTIIDGELINVVFATGNQGANYIQPKFVINDPANTGSDASADLILDNSSTFTSADDAFGFGDPGKIIRMGGGIATITAVISAREVIANLTVPIANIRPNSGSVPQTAKAGDWTITSPVTTISGLAHLAGATVTGIADGNVITPRVVSPTGTITLDAPASAVIIGLGFTAQLQTVYFDSGEPTVQGQRKKIAAVTARIENSREFTIGTNQLDGSTQSPIQVETAWLNMAEVPSDGPNFPPKPYNAVAIPLRTGDIRSPVNGGFQTPGQISVQQSGPLPLQILALIPEGWPGDTPQNQYPKRQQQGGRGQ